MGRVEGKVALITGAARGQGRNHAVHLAREGADVVAVDACAQVESAPYGMPTPEDLQETARQVEAAGRRAVARQADVRDLEGLRAAVQTGVDELGALDIVIANAGILSIPGPVVEIGEQTWQEMIDVNLTGVFHTLKVSVPHLSDGASVIVISSAAGLKAHPNVGHYVAAKHGLVGLTRTLAKELGPRMIRVNSVHPTNVDTPMFANDAMFRLFAPDKPEPGRDDVLPAASALHMMPTGWIETDDVSNAVLFLASPESRYITGVALPIDAGFAAM
jgi:SDR family mycofactocin-dependent oxidoreductase